jgi:hypothetical protein
MPKDTAITSYELTKRSTSPVQNPEKLFREQGFLLYMMLSAALFVVLMFTHIPVLYDWFNIEPSQIHPLWMLGTSGLQ